MQNLFSKIALHANKLLLLNKLDIINYVTVHGVINATNSVASENYTKNAHVHVKENTSEMVCT